MTPPAPGYRWVWAFTFTTPSGAQPQEAVMPTTHTPGPWNLYAGTLYVGDRRCSVNKPRKQRVPDVGRQFDIHTEEYGTRVAYRERSGRRFVWFYLESDADILGCDAATAERYDTEQEMLYAAYNDQTKHEGGAA